MFSPFGCAVIDSRMKILIHTEKMRFECTKQLMHIKNHDRQIKLTPVVRLEPTIRLRRINSQARSEFCRTHTKNVFKAQSWLQR